MNMIHQFVIQESIKKSDFSCVRFFKTQSFQKSEFPKTVVLIKRVDNTGFLTDGFKLCVYMISKIDEFLSLIFQESDFSRIRFLRKQVLILQE